MCTYACLLAQTLSRIAGKAEKPTVAAMRLMLLLLPQLVAAAAKPPSIRICPPFLFPFVFLFMLTYFYVCVFLDKKNAQQISSYRPPS